MKEASTDWFLPSTSGLVATCAACDLQCPSLPSRCLACLPGVSGIRPYRRCTFCTSDRPYIGLSPHTGDEFLVTAVAKWSQEKYRPVGESIPAVTVGLYFSLPSGLQVARFAFVPGPEASVGQLRIALRQAGRCQETLFFAILSFF